jgi:hypothetical protein
VRSFKFYKNEHGWFVDLPEWEGEVWDLQMVMGADTFLDILSQGEEVVHVTLSTTPFEGCEILHYQYQGRLEGPEYGEGAWYFLNEYIGMSMTLEVWLCDVTKFVFGDFPIKIYFK